jgi:hypothetical protein
MLRYSLTPILVLVSSVGSSMLRYSLTPILVLVSSVGFKARPLTHSH